MKNKVNVVDINQKIFEEYIKKIELIAGSNEEKISVIIQNLYNYIFNFEG